MKGITDHAALKASLPAKDRWGLKAAKRKRHPNGADACHAGTIPFPGFIPKYNEVIITYYVYKGKPWPEKND